MFPSCCTVGWSDFEEKNVGTCHDVVDCHRTRNPKLPFDLLLFHLAKGLTGPQKNCAINPIIS